MIRRDRLAWPGSNSAGASATSERPRSSVASVTTTAPFGRSIRPGSGRTASGTVRSPAPGGLALRRAGSEIEGEIRARNRRRSPAIWTRNGPESETGPRPVRSAIRTREPGPVPNPCLRGQLIAKGNGLAESVDRLPERQRLGRLERNLAVPQLLQLLGFIRIEDHHSPSRFRAEPQGQPEVVTVVEGIDDLAERPVAEVEPDHGRSCEPVRLDLTPDGFDQGADARPDPRVTRVGGRPEGRQGLAAEALQGLVGRHAVVERFGAQPPDQRDRVGRVVGRRRREHERQQEGCEHGRVPPASSWSGYPARRTSLPAPYRILAPRRQDPRYTRV